MGLTVVDYRYIVSDQSTGRNIGEIPFTPSGPITMRLNGVGGVEGTCPKNVKALSDQNFDKDLELTVLRDDIPIWNGPVTFGDGSLRSPLLTVRAAEASQYLWMRTLEVDYAVTADVFDIIRFLITHMTTKTASGGDGMTAGADILAGLPRFGVSPASGDAGVTQTVNWKGSDRLYIGDLLAQMLAFPSSGFDWRMDYTSGSFRQTCQRTLTLGAPNLGVLRTEKLNNHTLYDFGKTIDGGRSATRVHTRGKGYTWTEQNAAAVAAGVLLTEKVFNRGDLSDPALLEDYTSDASRRSKPPVSAWVASYVPGRTFPFGWCDLGDHVRPYISDTWTDARGVDHNSFLTSVGNRRVVEIAIAPPTETSVEIVALTTDVPLDSVGSG